MTTQSAFAEQVVAPSATEVTFVEHLAKIKNEEGGQKYDSVTKALDALAHSQAYIPQLKTEVETKDAEIVALKAQLAQTASVEEVVSRLNTPQDLQVGHPPLAEPTHNLDEAAVLNLVQQYNSQKEAETTASSNELLVSDALIKKFGDKTTEVLKLKATELGLSVEDLQGIAQRSPKAALQLFQAGGTLVQPTTPSLRRSYIPPESTDLTPPSKSLLRGATTKEQVDYMNKIKDSVYQKYDIQV